MYRRQRLVRIFHHWRRAIGGKAFKTVVNGEIILTEIGEVVYKRAKEITVSGTADAPGSGAYKSKRNASGWNGQCNQ